MNATDTPRKRAAARARKATATRRKRTDPLVRAEQQRQIVNGFVMGLSVDEIVQATQLSASTVYKEKRALIEQKVGERDSSAAALREAELMRLDRLQRAHWTNALAGHIGSSKIVLQCIDKRCKLLGLDAPTRINVEARTQLDAQIESLIDELETNGLVTSKGSKS